MADLCLDCHTDLLENPRGFHSVMLAQSKVLSCYHCHPDHKGPNAPLTVMDLKDFPHKEFGFSLQAHQKKPDQSAFTCSDCHALGEGVPSDFKHFDVQTCDTCHRKLDLTFSQTHAATFGLECLVCHDGVDSYGRAFDHNRQAFPLQGKHAAATCAGCHQDARSIADLKAAAQDCFACHKKDDPHNGQFGQDCSKCHTPDGWTPAKFDHSLSAFQLLGKHASVACQDCHVNNVFKGTPQDCFSCHKKDDPHNGQFGQDCNACHTPEGWTPAKFDHSLAAFPLVGKHINAPCQDCHVNNVFKGTPQDCYSCHAKADAHQGQFGTDCGACHTPVDWAQTTFDHAKTAFPLTGAHLKLKCTQCHVNNVFKGTPTQCVSCHAEPVYHKGLFGVDCQACHSTDAWSPAKFTGKHAFPLRHGGAGSCRQCHPSTLSSWTCYTCHPKNNITAKHVEEGIRNFDNCLRCHPTGQGGG